MCSYVKAAPYLKSRNFPRDRHIALEEPFFDILSLNGNGKSDFGRKVKLHLRRHLESCLFEEWTRAARVGFRARPPRRRRARCRPLP